MAKNTPQSDESREPTLPDSELEVMRILWSKQHATARQVWAELQQSGSRWTYATVNTLLQRLEGKGLAISDKSQMSFVYSPTVSRQQVVRRRVSQLVDKLYDGNGGQLVMHLIKSQALSKEELKDIRDVLRDVADDHETR